MFGVRKALLYVIERERYRLTTGSGMPFCSKSLKYTFESLVLKVKLGIQIEHGSNKLRALSARLESEVERRLAPWNLKGLRKHQTTCALHNFCHRLWLVHVYSLWSVDQSIKFTSAG